VKKEGVLQSPGFPDTSYTPSTFLRWQLRAEPGHRVRLEFHTFTMEDDCQKDFIKLYDSLVPIEHLVLAESVFTHFCKQTFAVCTMDIHR